MSALGQHLRASLRLYFRNRMALLYGYLFPTVFLGAFWVLYRYEQVPLLRHMGELLTVSILGGACFGMPTTLVSERERGVWRRYRLTPIPTASLVASTMLSRYVLLLTAGALQLGIALAVGMTMPKHPFDLWVAFSFAAFAFLGLGLVMAAVADTVPAVQALGQCIFLPMLIVGGVAVPLAALPEWAQHLSAFLPGRYGVELIQASVSGDGIGARRFSLLALLLIGLAGCVAGAKLFRWDARERFVSRGGYAWIGLAVSAWIAVGLTAESRGRAGSPRTPEPQAATNSVAAPTPATVPSPSPGPIAPAPLPAPATVAPERRSTVDTARVEVPKQEPKKANGGQAAPETAHPIPASWQAVTLEDIERDLIFTRLPSDAGVVTPIARADDEPEPEVAEKLEFVRQALPGWGPAQVADPVQRVRNILFVAAVPDVFQAPLERFAPWVVYERLQADIPQDTLIKILYWIALHPQAGDDSAVDQLGALQLGNGPSDIEETKERVAVYAVKLLGRVLGKIRS
jgi:ABC-2 type transport system permease protein